MSGSSGIATRRANVADAPRGMTRKSRKRARPCPVGTGAAGQFIRLKTPGVARKLRRRALGSSFHFGQGWIISFMRQRRTDRRRGAERAQESPQCAGAPGSLLDGDREVSRKAMPLFDHAALI